MCSVTSLAQHSNQTNMYKPKILLLPIVIIYGSSFRCALQPLLAECRKLPQSQTFISKVANTLQWIPHQNEQDVLVLKNNSSQSQPPALGGASLKWMFMKTDIYNCVTRTNIEGLV
jgi:hypothetical protein